MEASAVQLTLFGTPLVQQLAALRLGDDDRATTEAAHASYFLSWLAGLDAAVKNAEGASLLAIDAEFENCRRAWRVATQNGRADALRSAARVALNYFDYRGLLAEGLAWLHQTTESAPCQADGGLPAMLLSHAAHFQYRMSRFEAARASATEALAVSAPARDRVTRYRALSVLGGCALQQGQLAEAQRRYTQALDMTPREATGHQTAATLDHLAIVEKRMGHYDESLRLSKSLWRSTGSSATTSAWHCA